MRHATKFIAHCALIAWVVTMVLGCKGTTPPINFYTLTPMPVIQNSDQNQTALRKS